MVEAGEQPAALRSAIFFVLLWPGSELSALTERVHRFGARAVPSVSVFEVGASTEGWTTSG